MFFCTKHASLNFVDFVLLHIFYLDFQILKNVNIVHLVLPPEIMVQHTMTWCGGAICFQNLSLLFLHVNMCWKNGASEDASSVVIVFSHVTSV
jgi:hypothetical protein